MTLVQPRMSSCLMGKAPAIFRRHRSVISVRTKDNSCIDRLPSCASLRHIDMIPLSVISPLDSDPAGGGMYSDAVLPKNKWVILGNLLKHGTSLSPIDVSLRSNQLIFLKPKRVARAV